MSSGTRTTAALFDERDVKWIRDLVCLKKCGMSIQEMKAYLDLCLQGPSTIPARKEMLTKKQEGPAPYTYIY